MRPVVFVDSNALKQSMDFSSGSWRRLLSLSKGRFLDLAVPTVVLREVARQWEEEYLEASRVARSKNDSLDGKLKIVRRDESIPRVDPPKLTQMDYYGFAEDVLRSVDAMVPDFPPVEVVDLLNADFAVRKPFKRDGTGMRDALIWATVKARVEAQSQLQVHADVYFVTANTRDFCEGDPPRLHSQLIEELPNGSGVKVVTDLKELFKEPPISELVEAIEVIEDSLTKNIVSARLESAIELVDLQSLGPMLTEDLGDGFTVSLLRTSLEEPEITYAAPLPDSTEWDVFRAQDQSTLVVEASIDVECEISGYLSNFEASTLDSASSIHIVDPFWNRHTVTALDSAVLNFHFIGEADPDGLTDIVFKLDSIDADF